MYSSKQDNEVTHHGKAPDILWSDGSFTLADSTANWVKKKRILLKFKMLK